MPKHSARLLRAFVVLGLVIVTLAGSVSVSCAVSASLVLAPSDPEPRPGPGSFPVTRILPLEPGTPRAHTQRVPPGS